jgi:hypothetical protein
MALAALLGFAVAFFADRLPEWTSDAQEASRAYLVGAGIQGCLSTFLAWRFWAFRRYVSGLLLLAIWIFEVIWKLADGTISAGGLFLYSAIAIAVANGVRACFAYNRIVNREATETGN